MCREKEYRYNYWLDMTRMRDNKKKEKRKTTTTNISSKS